MWYASVDMHHGAEPMFRSDIETLVYCTLEWCEGPLPWHKTSDNKATLVYTRESCDEKLYNNAGSKREIVQRRRVRIHNAVYSCIAGNTDGSVFDLQVRT